MSPVCVFLAPFATSILEKIFCLTFYIFETFFGAVISFCSEDLVPVGFSRDATLASLLVVLVFPTHITC